MCVVGASRNVGAPIAKIFSEGKATSKLMSVHWMVYMACVLGVSHTSVYVPRVDCP